MNKNILTTGILFISVFFFSGCFSGQNTGSNLSPAPANTAFLNSAELKKLFTGRTARWTSLRNDSQWTHRYDTNGTYSRIRTWEVTRGGYKRNIGGREPTYLKVYKKGNKYIGVNREGKDLYKFTVKSNEGGKPVTITPASGKFLSPEEVRRLYSGNTSYWTRLEKGREGRTTYYADGTYSSIRGSWKVTDDGFKCQTKKRNNRERCRSFFQDGSAYYVVNKEGVVTHRVSFK